MTDLPRPCLVCGEPGPGSWCPEHAPTRARARRPPTKLPFRQAGYDGAWDRLSARARRLQPFCLDCGSTRDLQADHLPSAWHRAERGLPLRLSDVEVLCAGCNVRRGSSRPGSERYEAWVSG